MPQEGKDDEVSMLQNGWKRIAKNLIQSIFAGIVYTVSLREWIPNTWPHIFNSFIVSVIIIINIVDLVFEDIEVLKKQGKIALISCIAITMFYEVVDNIPEQQWWQNASLVSLLGSCLVARLEYLIPYRRNFDNHNLKIKDKAISTINSFGLYKALCGVVIDDFLAVLITSFIVVHITVDFDKDKNKRDNQEHIAVIVTLMSTILTMFFNIYMNMYISLIIGLGMSNPLFTYAFGRISFEEKTNEDEKEEDDSTDIDSDEKSEDDIEDTDGESDEVEN